MNRVILSAFAATLLLANPAALLAQEKTMTTSTGMELVWIPAGEFTMGSTAEEQDWAIENRCGKSWVSAEGSQQQKVAIKEGLWFGRTEVTVGQWKKFVAATNYITDGEKSGSSTAPNKDKRWGTVKDANWKDPNFGFNLKDNHPVSCISWNDAVAFCVWLTDEFKKSGKLPSGMICRLPTEAEWEYAARAGSQTRFWWGNTVDGAERRCNTLGGADGFEFVSPVDHFGVRGRNRFGLADMIGNVEEWCLDDYEGSSAHAECYKSSSSEASYRGAAWSDYLATARCAHRYGRPKNISHASFGFRVCCGSPEGGGKSLGVTGPVAKTKTDSPKSIPAPSAAGEKRTATVADAESQKDAKKFAKNQSTIKGLFILTTSMGQRMGGAQDIIATIERGNSNMETICDIFADVAKDTKISMEEAERLLKVRYPVWEAGRKIRFSYGDKYTKQAGGSAGGAFSVLLLSLLDGFQIDPGFAMTGDVTVDGKIRQVGAVAEKIRGAKLEKCTMVAIPLSNKDSLNDLAILYTPAMFWSIQIVSISTLDDAAAMARLDKNPNLSRALMMFYQIQKGLGPYAPVAYLRNQDTYTTLQQVLQLAPNHLSAEFMLRAANNQLPTTLSLNGSIEEIWAASALMRGYLLDEKAPDPKKNTRFRATQVPAEAIKVAQERLAWLENRLHPKTRDFRGTMYDYIQSLDYLRRQGGASNTAYSHYLARRDRVLGELIKLGTDRNTLEEMMH